MGKTIPTFKTDEEAEVFVETADLSDYDLSGFKPVHFEFHAKDRRINMRLPQPLLEAVKAAAKSEGVPSNAIFAERSNGR
jgi:predicted DNA binding CopG/RHH family protein